MPTVKIKINLDYAVALRVLLIMAMELAYVPLCFSFLQTVSAKINPINAVTIRNI